MELVGIPVDTLAPAALLGVCILLILTGRLVPRRTLEDANHDRNEWRAAHRISEAARAELAEQQRTLLEQGETSLALLRSLTTSPRADQQDVDR